MQNTKKLSYTQYDPVLTVFSSLLILLKNLSEIIRAICKDSVQDLAKVFDMIKNDYIYSSMYILIYIYIHTVVLRRCEPTIMGGKCC